MRNNHKNAERVQFEDQLPVSRNEQIQVTLLEPKAQEIKREDDGKLKWDWTLQPGEKRSAALKFSVEYPGPGGQRPRLALAKAPAAA